MVAAGPCTEFVSTACFDREPRGGTMGIAGTDGMHVVEIAGWSHVAVSVTDLERSVDWYREVFGVAELFRFATDDFERVVLGHPSGVVLALTRHRATGGDTFDPVRVGLDHLSWRVQDEDALDAWAGRLDELGIEHGGLQRTLETGSVLVAFRDPDGIQLEVYVQAGPPTAT